MFITNFEIYKVKNIPFLLDMTLTVLQGSLMFTLGLVPSTMKQKVDYYKGDIMIP